MTIFEKIVFSDLNDSPVSKESLKINIDALKYSVLNLISTDFGERLNLTGYGVNLPDNLFDPMDEITAWSILNSIVDAISLWEPRLRVDISRSSVTPDYDNHKYEVLLALTVIGYPGLDFTLSGVYKNIMK